MTMKILAAATIGAAALLSAPHNADAGSKVKRDVPVVRDCKPYNGPFGYYDNPYCSRGYKFAEDYAPGTGGYFDVFELPQVRRLSRRWE